MFQNTYHYQDPSDKDSPPDERTTFYLKPLTVGDMMEAEGTFNKVPSRPGTRIFTAFQRGLVGWKNFIWVKRNGDGEIVEDLAYAPEHLDRIPIQVMRRIVDKIYEISILDKGVDEELKAVVRTAFLKSNSKEGQQRESWDCEACKKIGGLQAKRHCSLEGFKENPKEKLNPEHLGIPLFPHQRKMVAKGHKPKFLTYGGHEFDECPIGLITPRAKAMYNIVMDCINHNVLPVNPPVLGAQPFLYYQAKNIIEGEFAELDRQKRESDSSKAARAKKPRLPRKTRLGRRRTA